MAKERGSPWLAEGSEGDAGRILPGVQELVDWGDWGMWSWAGGDEMDGPSLPGSCFLPLSAQRWKGRARAVGHQGEERFVFCSVFITSKQQSCTVGAPAVCPGVVAQEVTNPAEGSSGCPGAVPAPRQRLDGARSGCRPRALVPGSCQTRCVVPLACTVPTGGLVAHPPQRTSLLPSVWFLTEENYPP